MNFNFGDSNIITCYIKELLHSFNLPRVATYTDDLLNVVDYVESGEVTSSGNSLYDGRVYVKDRQIVKYNNGNFDKIANYVYNYPILNFTKNFVIKSSTYDFYTHKYLGDYLRFMRDYNNLNLMSMYNCFTGEEPRRIYLQDNEGKEGVSITSDYKFKLNTDDNNYNYYLTPVKFDKTYTIALSSNIKYDLACILYNDIFISATPDELIRESYMHVDGSTFSEPFTYSTKWNCTKNLELWKKEKDLMLLIKIPKLIDTSIVILEGNYISCTNILDGSIYGKFITDVAEGANNYISKLSLLAVNDQQLHPIAPRLIEYLLGQAITNIDHISRNIEYVQNMIYKEGMKGFYGVWDDELHYNIYKKTLENNLIKGQNLKYSNTLMTSNLDKNIVYTIDKDNESIYKFKADNWYTYKEESGEVIKVMTNLKIGGSYMLREGDEFTVQIDGETKTFTNNGKSTYVIKNNTSSELLNNNEDKYLTKGTLEITYFGIEKLVKRFIDSYYDILGYVDKDVETILRLENAS